MQTDLQLLLLIIGLVFGGFILYNTFRQKSKKTTSTFEEFEAPTTQNIHKDRKDPLLDGYEEELAVLNEPVLGKQSVAKQVVAENVLQPKVEINQWTVDAMEPLIDAKVTSEPLFEGAKPPVKRKVVKPTAKTEFIALSIIPKSGSFTGAMLTAALKANHFHYGEHKIFHRHVDDNPKSPILFSAASLVEPGHFEIHQMTYKSFPGILLWIMLPVSEDAMQSFDKLLKSARQLASFLNGELCDTKRLILTTEAIATIRERVHQFQVTHEQALEYELDEVR